MRPAVEVESMRISFLSLDELDEAFVLKLDAARIGELTLSPISYTRFLPEISETLNCQDLFSSSIFFFSFSAAR